MYAYKKRTDRPECGLTFKVSASTGNVGGIYSNPKDLKQYIKRKAKQGFKLERVRKPDCANKRFFEIWIYKDRKTWEGVE